MSFSVTPDSLRALQSSLLGLAAELDNGDVSASQFQSAAGDGVNGAAEIMGEFFLNWSASLGVTGNRIENVANKLAAAASDYEKTDSSCMPEPTGSGSVNV